MVMSELHENFAGYCGGERRMHIAASSSHHTLDANKETASSGGLAGNRRDKKGFWPVYYSLELFIIFTAFPRWFGGRGKAVYPKARRWMRTQRVWSRCSVWWTQSFGSQISNRVFAALPLAALQGVWTTPEGSRGGEGEEGGDKHPRYKICNPRKLTNLTVSACRPPVWPCLRKPVYKQRIRVGHWRSSRLDWPLRCTQKSAASIFGLSAPKRPWGPRADLNTFTAGYRELWLPR